MSRGKSLNRRGTQQVQVPITKQVLFTGVALEVQRLPDGGRQLQVIDPAAGTAYLIPLSPELSRKLGSELFAAVPTANGSVPEEPGS